MSAHILTIGDITLDEDSDDEIKFVVEISSARKLDTKEGDGDDDGTITRKGRKVRDVTIRLSWPSDEVANSKAVGIIEKLDACLVLGKGSDPPSFGYERDGMDVGQLKAVRAIEIEETKGPNRTDKGENEYEIKAKSWVKPPPKANTKAGTTATDPKMWTAKKSGVANFGGIPGNTVTFGGQTPKTPAPTVKPK